MKKILIVVPLVFFLACNDIENCDANNDLSFLTIAFYDAESIEAKKVGFSIGSGDTEYTGIYFEDSTAAILPLNPLESEISFFFISDTSEHELTLSYNLQVSIFDPDCDASVTFTGLDTLSYSFDSLAIPGTVTNRQIDTNVEVYF